MPFSVLMRHSCKIFRQLPLRVQKKLVCNQLTIGVRQKLDIFSPIGHRAVIRINSVSSHNMWKKEVDLCRSRRISHLSRLHVARNLRQNDLGPRVSK